jgi:glucosamine 6-phosphate synthetase-like amidotransferase/phosphosugar isomerase protein
LFRKEASIEIERHRSSQDSCKFYNRLNHQVLARRKEHIEEHLNKGSESEQPTRPVDLRDDGVEIDSPSLEAIEGALKYLKNNKAAGAQSIAAELLNHGGPNLVDVLHEVIHRGYCVQCKKGR